MLEEINIQIDKIKSEVARKQILENKLEVLKKQLDKAKTELYDLEDNLEKEKRDVDNLKKKSLSNLVSTVLGNKSEKIEKEEQEYIMAKIKYDSAKSKVALINSDILDIQKRLRDVLSYQSRYNQLLKKKIELINIYSDESTKNKLIAMEENTDKYLKEIKEIEESVLVGNRLLDEIEKAKDLLESAKGWSAIDLFGGDFLSSMAKHSKIDEAQKHFSRISNLTNSFNKELGDVNLEGVGFSSTEKAFDIFFDNIFSDLAANEHINKSYNNVRILERDVDTIMRKLKNNKERLFSLVNSQKSEYDEFIKSIK